VRLERTLPKLNERARTVKEVLDYFTELGHQVDQKWSGRGRRTDQLADISADALREIEAPSTLTPEGILEYLAKGAELPKQRPSSDQFGQPPVVMFRTSDLEIQAITWMEGTTSTHQHGFDGAFRVAWGSSLQVGYSFEHGETLADGHMVAGRLAMIEPEILRAGDVRPIYSGPDFIHALFHLERPSVTIVVRNSSSNLPFPQYNYRLPGVGFDANDSDDKLRMRMRGLHSLYKLDRGQAASVVRDAIATEEMWTAFRVCDEWALAYGLEAGASSFVEILCSRSEIFKELLPSMYDEEFRRGRLLMRRGMLRESRHRLFLALIVNLPDRAAIHRALEQLFPGEDPAQVMVNLIRELASPEYRGISGLNLSEDALTVITAQLVGGHSDVALGTVAALWKPSSLLETLFA
jgi:hypothetical protein